MSSILTENGLVQVGDTVEFSYSTGNKKGKVTGIKDKTLTIYCVDRTGAYTLQCPHYNITKICPIDKVEENTFPSELVEFFSKKQEDIKKPARYNKRGKLECWDVILDQEMNFLEGNIIKYLWRYKEKNGIEDLKKARVYLDKLISEVEKK